jgi:REP element-mobilizing transposase RayT
MARRLRYIPPGGALVEITCRTIQGRLLLRPSAGMNEVIRGVLARAARLAGLAVHAPVFLSNHYHLLVSVVDSQQLAQFMNYLNSNLAREAGRLVGWREKFWGRRFQAVIVSDEEEAQVGRLAYVLAQGVKEGLVASPVDWPGVHCAQALTEGSAISGRWHNRTLETKARRKGLALEPQAFVEQESLQLTPLPCWKSLPPEESRARVQQLIEAIEADARLQQEETGKAPLGADAVCLQNPHHEPNRMKKGPAPLVHAVAPAVRRSLRKAYFAFREAYRYAANRLRAGATDFEFPVGAFPPRLPIRLAARAG